jgi:hypothetical protein
LAEPTKPMNIEALKTGYFEASCGKVPKLQISTDSLAIQWQMARHPLGRLIRVQKGERRAHL